MTTLLDADFAVCEFSPRLRALVEVVGLPAATALAVRYGGTELPVPSQFNLRHPLVAVIGAEAAQKLVQFFQNERLYIPRGADALRCARNRLITGEYDAGGTTAATLALKYHLTERQVRTILNKMPEPASRQPAFDFGE